MSRSVLVTDLVTGLWSGALHHAPALTDMQLHTNDYPPQTVTCHGLEPANCALHQHHTAQNDVRLRESHHVPSLFQSFLAHLSRVRDGRASGPRGLPVARASLSNDSSTGGVHAPAGHLGTDSEAECDLVVSRALPSQPLGSLERDQEFA